MSTLARPRVRSTDREIASEAFNLVAEDPKTRALVHVDHEHPEQSMSVDTVLLLIKKVEMIRIKDAARGVTRPLDEAVTSGAAALAEILVGRSEGYRRIALRYYSLISSRRARSHLGVPGVRRRRRKPRPEPLELT